MGTDADETQIWGSKFPALNLENGAEWRQASAEPGLPG